MAQSGNNGRIIKLPPENAPIESRAAMLERAAADQAAGCLQYLISLAKPEDRLAIIGSGRVNSQILGAEYYSVLDDFLEWHQGHPQSSLNYFLSERRREGRGVEKYIEPANPAPFRPEEFWDQYWQLEKTRQDLAGIKAARKLLERLEGGEHFNATMPAELQSALSPSRAGGPVSKADYRETARRYFLQAANPGALYLPSGYPEFDKLAHGYRRGGTTVIAGRPGSGKTLWATTAAVYALKAGRHSVGFVSTEMSHDEIMGRLMIGAANLRQPTEQEPLISVDPAIDGSALGKGCGAEQWGEAMQAQEEIFAENNRFDLLAENATSIEDIEGFVRACVCRHSMDILFVDYWQNIRGGNGRDEREKMKDIAQRLNDLAKRYNFSLVCLAQLRRSNAQQDQGGGSHPGVEDLANSDELGRLACLICCLSRYQAASGSEFGDQPFYTFNAADIVKNRYGQLGLLQILVQGRYGLITETCKRETWPERYVPGKAGKKAIGGKGGGVFGSAF